MNYCYLCGKDGDRPLDLPKTFTAHNLAKNPTSDVLCDRCYGTIAGDEKQLYYWNENKNPPAWSKLWGRSLSRLYVGEELRSPIIEGEREGTAIVHSLPTRVEIRQWLINPPEPPFTIAISVSGQKHILPFAQEAHDRERFPIRFELTSLEVNRQEFTRLLANFEMLYDMGLTKAEILKGNYSVSRVAAIPYADFLKREEEIAQYRGTDLLELAAFVAQKEGAIE